VLILPTNRITAGLGRTMQVTWICHDCGMEHGRPPISISTWHYGKFDVCKEEKSVTEGRDYGVREIRK